MGGIISLQIQGAKSREGREYSTYADSSGCRRQQNNWRMNNTFVLRSSIIHSSQNLNIIEEG